MSTTEVLRVIVMASSLAGLVILFAIAWRFPQIWLYTIPPILILVNMAVFTASRLMCGVVLSPALIPLFNQWGYIVQLQVAFTITAIGGYILWTRR